MVLMVHSGKTSSMEMQINRTYQSGGSLGGDKKAGIVNMGPSWPLNSVQRHLAVRAPQRIPSVAFALYNTTLHPVQQKGSTIARLGMMLG